VPWPEIELPASRRVFEGPERFFGSTYEYDACLLCLLGELKRMDGCMAAQQVGGVRGITGRASLIIYLTDVRFVPLTNFWLCTYACICSKK
jgi:hypothetical protein